MKKKKFLSLAMAAVMTAAMSLSAVAAEVKIQATDLVNDVYGNLGDPSLQRDSQIGLGPKSVEDKDTSGCVATLNVDAEGDYTLRFCYVGAASGESARKFSYQIDNGERVDVQLEITDSWNTVDAKIYEVSGVHFTVGEHKIKMGASSDFNNEKTAGGVKTPNIVYVSYEAEAAAPEVPGDDEPIAPTITTIPVQGPVNVDGDNATSETVANPLKSLTEAPAAIEIEASISSDVKLAAWRVMFGFIKDGTDGFADFCRWPMIQLNEMTNPNVYANYTTGDDNLLADSNEITDGTPNVFKWVITKTGVTLSVDGVNYPIIVDKDGVIASENALYGELCTALFDWLMSADKIEFGNAAGPDKDWWGELACTINSLKVNDVVIVAEPENPGPGTEDPANPSAGADDPVVDPVGPGTEDPENPSAGADDPVVDPENPSAGTNDPVVDPVQVEVKDDTAKEVADSAVVTGDDVVIKNAVLTVAPADEAASKAAADLVKADDKLAAAGLKAFAAVDITLKIGDKEISVLDRKLQIKVAIDAIFTDVKENDTVAVYRVDEKDGAAVLSFLGNSKVDKDGDIVFSTDHFSTYVFALVDKDVDATVVEYSKDIDNAAKVDMTVDEIVKTGDKAPILPFAIAAVLALAVVMGYVVVSKKRNA